MAVTGIRYSEGKIFYDYRTVSANAPTNPKMGSSSNPNTLVWNSRSGDMKIYSSSQKTADDFYTSTTYGNAPVNSVPTTQQKASFQSNFYTNNGRVTPETIERPNMTKGYSRYSTDTNYQVCNPVNITTCQQGFIPSQTKASCQTTQTSSGTFRSPF